MADEWRPWKSYCLLILVVSAIVFPLSYLIWTLTSKHKNIEIVESSKLEKAEPSYPATYSPGIVISEVSPAPIYYESYMPLIVEHKLPDFDALLKNNATASSLCRNSRKFSSVSFKSCPEEIDPNLKFSLKNVLSAVTSRNWMHKGSSSLRIGEHGFYENNLEFCSKITNHFVDNLMETKALEEYLKSMENCSPDRFIASALIKNHFNITDIISQLSKTNRHFPSHDLSVYSTIFKVSTEWKKWEVRFENCKSDRILYNPFNFKMENDVHKNVLSSLESRVELDDIHQLSISSDDFEQYKNLRSSLTDCVFSSDNTFIERILIPIIPKKSNYLTFSVKAIPFVVSSPSGDDQLCSLSNTDNKKFIYEEKSQRFMPVESCESQSLCRISKNYEFKSLSELNCVSAIFFNNTENISKFCQFECQPLKNSDMFRRVSSDSIILVSVTPDLVQFFYRCEDGVSYPIHTKVSDVASLKVTLPCNCKLYKNFDQIFSSVSPCTNKSVNYDASVVQILPLDIFKLSDQLVKSTNQVNYVYNLQSTPTDPLFIMFGIAIVMMIISVYCKISYQEKQIQSLTKWQENELEHRIQYFNENRELVRDNLRSDLIDEKKVAL